MSEPSPHDREYVYRHIWPIVDEDRPISALKVEASAAIGPILGRLGVRPTAQPRYLVADDRLVCEIPVLRLDGDSANGVDEAAVIRLVQVGWTDRHIAAELGYDPHRVGKIRRDAGYEPNGERVGMPRVIEWPADPAHASQAQKVEAA